MMRVVSAVALTVAAASLVGATNSRPRATYVQAEDHTPPELALRESGTIVANCSACHSLDYITTQPRGKGPQFWRDTVAKMVTTYKAPIEPAEAEAIAAQLARKFGTPSA